MRYKVNGILSEEDGDWLQCDQCQGGEAFIILKWMNYCPVCGQKLNIEEVEETQ